MERIGENTMFRRTSLVKLLSLLSNNTVWLNNGLVDYRHCTTHCIVKVTFQFEKNVVLFFHGYFFSDLQYTWCTSSTVLHHLLKKSKHLFNRTFTFVFRTGFSFANLLILLSQLNVL